MAERRMFAKSIIDSDAFLEMPMSTQCLYFHLAMRADDEGFVGNPRAIQRTIGASNDDMKLLIAKRFLLTFESGVVVIKHWKIHNYIQNDRAKTTTYLEEKATLTLDGKKAYIEKQNTECIQNVYTGKNSIGKNSIVEYSIEESTAVDTSTACTSKNNAVAILMYLNEKAGTHFKAVDSNIKFVLARLKDYTVDDLKAVIEKKVSEWKGTTMQQYLRPETLFNATKFESYYGGLKEIKQTAVAVGGIEVERREYTDDDFKALYSKLD